MSMSRGRPRPPRPLTCLPVPLLLYRASVLVLVLVFMLVLVRWGYDVRTCLVLAGSAGVIAARTSGGGVRAATAWTRLR